jgi:anti-sigma B factor antagonist
MELEIRSKDGVSVVSISGPLTLGENTSTLRNALRGLSAGGQTRILLDLAGVTYIDSSGLGVLVSNLAKTTNLGGQLKLLNLTHRVKDLLLIAKLLTVFEVYRDEPSAIRSFPEFTAAATAAG